MVEIYTDASVGKQSAVTTSFILTDLNYIGSAVSTFPGVTTSILGEIKGAIAAIEYAEQSLNLREETVVLSTDSIAMINLLKCNLDKTSNKQAQMYVEDLRKLKNLVTKYSISLKLVRGHEVGHNPNKVVDLMSNCMLRFKKREG